MQCMVGSSCSSGGADLPPCSSDRLQGRAGEGRWGGWSQTSLLRFSHTRLKQTGRRGVAFLKAFTGPSRRDCGADKQAGDNPAEFSLSSLSHHFLYGWRRKAPCEAASRDRRFLRRQTALVRGNGGKRSLAGYSLRKTIMRRRLTFGSRITGRILISQALCAIDLRSLPSLPASVPAARMKTSTARGAKMQKIIYLQCFPTPTPSLTLIISQHLR